MKMRIELQIIMLVMMLALPIHAAKDERVTVFPQLGHKTAVSAVALSKDGHYTLSASRDGIMKLWDCLTGREMKTFKVGDADIGIVTLSAEARYAATASAGFLSFTNSVFGKYVNQDTITLWDLASGNKIVTLMSEISNNVRALSFTPDQQCVVAAVNTLDYFSADGATFVGYLTAWEVPTGRRMWSRFVVSNEITSIAVSPDGRRIICGISGPGNRLRIMETATGREIGTPIGQFMSNDQESPMDSTNSPDGRQVLFMANEKYTPDFTSVSVSPDGRQVLFMANDNESHESLTMWDVESGRKVKSYEIDVAEDGFVAFLQDGSNAISCVKDCSEGLVLWNTITGCKKVEQSWYIAFRDWVAEKGDSVYDVFMKFGSSPDQLNL